MFVGRRRLELAVDDAIIAFNDGELARKTIFSALGLNCGVYLTRGLEGIDRKRLKTAYIPGQKAVIKARRIRSLNASLQKDDSYGAGCF